MFFTSGFLGEILTAVGVTPVLGVTGSFLGDIIIFVGEIVLLFSCSSLSSSLFFIMASLELVLVGTGFFFGDGPITSSDVLPL